MQERGATKGSSGARTTFCKLQRRNSDRQRHTLGLKRQGNGTILPLPGEGRKEKTGRRERGKADMNQAQTSSSISRDTTLRMEMVTAV